MLPTLSSLKGKLALVLFLAQAAVLTDKTGRVTANSRLVKDTTSLVISMSYELKLAVIQVQK